MSLHAEWTDEELPELQAFINRALNTADPATTPKWAWKLDAAVTAKINDLKREQQRATLIAALGPEVHSKSCLTAAGGNQDDECICGAHASRKMQIDIIDQQLGPKEFISDHHENARS